MIHSDMQKTNYMAVIERARIGVCEKCGSKLRHPADSGKCDECFRKGLDKAFDGVQVIVDSNVPDGSGGYFLSKADFLPYFDAVDKYMLDQLPAPWEKSRSIF